MRASGQTGCASKSAVAPARIEFQKFRRCPGPSHVQRNPIMYVVWGGKSNIFGARGPGRKKSRSQGVRSPDWHSWQSGNLTSDYPTSDWIVNWNSICHPNQPCSPCRMWLSDPLSVAEWIYDGITWWLVWPAADRVVKCPDDIFTVDCWWSSSNCWSPKAKLHSWNFRIFFSCNKG